jgi:adenylate cyclase
LAAEGPRLRRIRGLIAIALGVALAIPALLPGLDYLHRLGIDFLLPLRHAAFGPLFAAEESDVVTVVIDEETYRTPPFTDTPEVAWTPFLARVLEAVAAGKPKVIGLDLVYPTSLDRPGLVPGYDKPLLKSFLKIGRPGGLVLGKVRLSREEITPYRGQIIAVGGAANLRDLTLLMDPDDVVRRYPAGFATEAGGVTPSFATELVRRAGVEAPAEGEFLIDYNTGADDIPAFGLSDLLACIEAGRGEFFERFRDKIVIVGTALDVEDRRIPAKRFATGRSDRSRHPRCLGAFDAERFGELIERHSMPALFIHAAAVNTLTKARRLTLLAPLYRFLVVFVGVALGAAVFFALPPAPGFLAAAGLFGAEVGASLLAFRAGTVWPVVMLGGAGLVAYTAVYAYRFVVEDKQKRWIQHAFRHYLAPALVDRLADDPSALELGGTRRQVTVFFSDLAGFTTISEGLKDTPELLVDILNDYLTVVTDIIESHGGYVDKFIGDAVMAVWGAPLDDAEAERHAVDAALDAQAALVGFNERLAREHPGVPRLDTRMGINTGPAVVGNMGSRTRLNYTVGGDTVNLAARLEGANKVYSSWILIGEDTAAPLGEDYLVRCLDYLTVKGKNEPVRVYEVVGRRGEVAAPEAERVTAFNRGYKMYLESRFEAAREAFAAYAESDAASTLYVERCTHYMASPPGPGWDGSFKLTEK